MRRALTIVSLTVVSLSALAACSTEARNKYGTSGDGPAFAAYDPGLAPGGPGAGGRYKLGGPPSDSLLAAWNRDVGPDGAELPPGEGSAAEGAIVYGAKCASCHGKAGEGMAPAYPLLISRDPKAEQFAFGKDPKLPKSIGNYWPEATTVFDYVRRAMPLTQPGSLTDHEVYAVTAFLLAANKVIADSAVLDAARLKAVKMPYRDRFVTDDRGGGPNNVK